MSDTDKIVKYVKDAQRRQLKVLPPSVNSSEFYFTVEQGAIYFGLGGIKGVGEAAIGAIVEARQTLPEKKFKNLEEFFNSVDPRKLNKKVLECLIKAGAFDGFGYHRAQLIHGYSKFLERAEGTRRDLALGQVSLFELNVGAETEITIDEVKPWNRHQSLYHEKDVLGFFLSDHPLNGYDELTAIWTTCPIADLGKTLEEHQKALSQSETKQKYDFRNRDGNKKRVIVSGLIQDIREVITKKGTRMAFGKIESLSGTCEIVVFPDTYSKYEQILKHYQPLMIGGFLEGENGAVKIIVDQFLLLEDALVKVKALRILLHKLPQEKFGKLQGVLKDHPGKTKVEMIMHIPEMNSQVTLETETPQEIQMSQRFIEELQENFGRTDFIEVMSI